MIGIFVGAVPQTKEEIIEKIEKIMMLKAMQFEVF